MTKTEWAVLVIGSGLAAGVANNLVSFLTGFLERNYRTAERGREEQHAATLRREAAHDEARSTYLPMAQSIVMWATKQAYDVHWQNVGEFVFPGTTRTLLTSESEVLDVIRDLMYGHPTQAVRHQARKLYDSASNQWSEIVGNDLSELTQEKVNEWENMAEELVMLIHTPEGSTLSH